MAAKKFLEDVETHGDVSATGIMQGVAKTWDATEKYDAGTLVKVKDPLRTDVDRWHVLFALADVGPSATNPLDDTTNWVLSGPPRDTGSRRVESLFQGDWATIPNTHGVHIRRIGSWVHFSGWIGSDSKDYTITGASRNGLIWPKDTVPAGFLPATWGEGSGPVQIVVNPGWPNGYRGNLVWLGHSGLYASQPDTSTTVKDFYGPFTMNWITDQAWPTSLPGTKS